VERIPILRMGEFLLVTIQVDMHDQLALTLQDDLAERIRKDSARGVLIDISALEIVDSFIGRMIAPSPACPPSWMRARCWWACSRRWPSRSSNWA
jgi:hypothetical protein